MAIYHLHVKIISRKGGRSATGAAAYRSGEKIADERTQLIHDYSRKQGVIYSEVIMPSESEWQPSRSELWNTVELKNKRADSQVAREFEIALPIELSDIQRQELTKCFVKEIADKYKVAADMSIHKPKDGENYHAHILTSTNRVDDKGFGNKVRELDMIANARGDNKDSKSGKNEIDYLRERWQILANEVLERAGHEARIDHRTLKKQGIDREPTEHEGVAVTAMERRGIQTQIRAENERKKQGKNKLSEVEKERSELQKQYEELVKDITNNEREIEISERHYVPYRKVFEEFERIKLKEPDRLTLIENDCRYLTFDSDAEEIAKILGIELEPNEPLILEEKDKRELFSNYSHYSQSVTSQNYSYWQIYPESFMEHVKAPKTERILQQVTDLPPVIGMFESDTEYHMLGLHLLFGQYDYEKQPDGAAVYRMYVDAHGLKSGDIAMIESNKRIAVYGDSEKLLEDALRLAAQKWENGFVLNGSDEWRERVEKIAERIGVPDKISNRINPTQTQQTAQENPTHPQKTTEPVEIPITKEAYDNLVRLLERETEKVLDKMKNEQAAIARWEASHALNVKIEKKREEVAKLSESEAAEQLQRKNTSLMKKLFSSSSHLRELTSEREKKQGELDGLLRERKLLREQSPVTPKFNAYTQDEARRIVEEQHPQHIKDIARYENEERCRQAEAAAKELVRRKEREEAERQRLEKERAEKREIIDRARKSPYGVSRFVVTATTFGEYEGIIVAVSENYAVQKISSEMAIIHELKHVPQLADLEGKKADVIYDSNTRGRAKEMRPGEKSFGHGRDDGYSR